MGVPEGPRALPNAGEGEPEALGAWLREYPWLRSSGEAAKRRAVRREEGKGEGMLKSQSAPKAEGDRVPAHRQADLRILKDDKGFRRTVWVTDLGGP